MNTIDETWVKQAILNYIFEEHAGSKRRGSLDLTTILWCVEKLCYSGMTYTEVLQRLDIWRPNEKTF